MKFIIIALTLLSSLTFSITETEPPTLKEKVNQLETSLFKKKKILETYEKDIDRKNEKYLQHVRVNKKLKNLLDEYKHDLSKEKLTLSERIKNIKTKMIKIAMLDNNEIAIENKILVKVLRKKLEKDFSSLETINSKIHSIESKVSSINKRIDLFEDESVKISEKLRIMNIEREEMNKSKQELFLAKDILEDEYLELMASKQFEKIKEENELKFISKTHLSNPIEDFISAKQLHKGLEFQVSINSGIMVIDDGEVVHSDVLANFGRIIIVKHKNNLRSVYLGDYESSIGINTNVKKSQKLGNVLPGDEAKIYFEIREKEKPLELARFYHLPSII